MLRTWFKRRAIYYLDLAERAFWTFLQGLAGFWIATGELAEATWSGAAVAGLLSVAKSLFASSVGDPDSAATLPAPPDAAPDER